jgi:hypothetical protein
VTEEKKRLRRTVVYYPVYEGENTGPEVEVTPKPLLIRQQSRPYIFPIIGQIIELIMSILEARLELIRSRAQKPREAMVPKTMVREVVRDKEGRVIEERFEIYGGQE